MSSIQQQEQQTVDVTYHEDHNYITLVDSRKSTVDELGWGSRISNITFYFEIDSNQNVVYLSRIFANSENGGGSALDLQSSLFSRHCKKSYSYRSLLDKHSINVLQGEFPEYYISTHTLRDRLYTMTKSVF